MKYSSTSKVGFVGEATVFSYFFKGKFFFFLRQLIVSLKYSYPLVRYFKATVFLIYVSKNKTDLFS